MKNLKLTLLAFLTLIVSCENDEPENVTQQIDKIEMQSVVFITGIDEDDNTFYKNAKTHFKQQQLTIVEDVSSIEDVILWLNAHYDGKNYDNIHIVSHSNAWRGIALRTCEDGERITFKSLKSVSFPKFENGVSDETNIIFHSCGLGANKDLMKALKIVFSSDVKPNLYASEFFNVFGGKYASHYLAQPFYVFYPTAHSPGNITLSDEIAHSYPSVSIDWLTALETRKETEAGVPYSYRFNIPVNWDIIFDDVSDIPELTSADDIMDFILENEDLSMALYELGIPMDKFRWDSISLENVLTIKGKTTVLCVLNPVMDTYVPAEYSIPDIEHPRLYTKF
ncbi:hypothetical protein M0G43_03725 [Subsaxibacter sp. CAU 1640]|uniref:hypothetical protein n=1 Tax=Subsaxibacter sp. CAU 1640 TaxID=2933271 RepID=UPI0020033EFB|nr:hypothetical protein [Subsaxibacter sp. CAU 1640]MCK7589672.1 hypothetical protein [Subsaxibacter sp. CAU 1640]